MNHVDAKLVAWRSVVAQEKLSDASSDSAIVQITSGSTRVNGVDASLVKQITIKGLAGADTIRLAAAATNGIQDITIATSIDGGDGADNIVSGLGNDSLTGGLGNDIINGSGGTDTLIESYDASFTLTNTQLSGVGTDTLTSIELAKLTGGAGNNTLTASTFSGSVTLEGGAGNDVLTGGNLADLLIGGAGTDKLVGNGGNDVLEGGAGDDTLTGGDGDDRFVFSGSVSLGADTITAGDNLGTNTLDLSAFAFAITGLNLGVTTIQAVNGTNLSLTIGSNDAIDRVWGTALNDKITGNALFNQLEGRSGNDTLIGGIGNDTLLGGLGNDSLDGGANDDSLVGDVGDDILVDTAGINVLNGGDGIDTINGLSESQVLTRIIDTYNSGRLSVQNVIGFIVNNGFGQDLPVVQESVGTALDIVSKLKTAFDSALSGTQQQIKDAFKPGSTLYALGFRLEYLEQTADTNGDFLRISYDRTVNVDHARFNIAGATGLDYFDKDVNGGLLGRFDAQSPAVTVHLTFGVDNLSNTPAFYVSDSSYVGFTGLHGQGQVNGEMAIRLLADVQAVGTLTVDLGGRLSLKDSDGDHKLRISDLSNTSSIVGDVDGSIVLNVDMTTNVSVLKNMTWHGDWRADIVDGRVNVGSPNLAMPSVDDVRNALISSLFDMKGSFDFLGPIGDVLFSKLDVLDRSLADGLGISDELGWIVGQVDDVESTLHDAGFTLNINADSVGKLIRGERVDLISFHQENSEALWEADASFLLGVFPIPLIFDLEVTGHIRAEMGWEYAVGFGVDTTGVWIDPSTRLGVYGGVRVGAEATLNIAGLLGVGMEAGAGVQVFAGLGLRDPDASDGRIYMDEIFAGVGHDGPSLFDAIGDVMKFDLRFEAQGYARAELNLPWPLPDITLFDESFSIGNISDDHGDATQTTSLRKIPLGGQGELALPAVLLADDTLMISGTAGRDFVGLTGRYGKVDVKWAGYRKGHFEGVNKIVFNGGDEDDQLTVSDDLNIAMELNGGNGDDLLMGGSANDTLNGGAGNDQLLAGGGNDVLNGQDGNDVADGGDGSDQVTDGIGRDLLQGGAGNDHLDGQDGDDALKGGADADELIGGLGDDALFGGSGNDVLDGNDGDDQLGGDEGNDILRGGNGKDLVSGGIGDDQLNGGANEDSLVGTKVMTV